MIGVVILVHYLNLPPTLTVTNWDMSNPLSPAATYTFGIGTGNTGTGGTCESAVWSRPSSSLEHSAGLDIIGSDTIEVACSALLTTIALFAGIGCTVRDSFPATASRVLQRVREAASGRVGWLTAG